MFRKFASAVFLAAVAVGVAAADQFDAVVFRLGDGRVAFKKMKVGQPNAVAEALQGKEEALPLAADIKVLRAKVNHETKEVTAGEELPGRFENEDVKYLAANKPGPGSVRTPARIITDAGGKTVTEMWFFLGPVPIAIIK